MSTLIFPPYVQQEVLLKALEKRLNASLQYVKVTSSANDAGTHMVGAIDFIIVTVRNKTTKLEQDVNLVVKYASPNVERNAVFEDAFDSPDKELVFLGKVCPEIKKFCEEAPMVGDRVQLSQFPHCYYVGGDDYKSIVIENVVVEGFKHHPANVGQNEEHARFVLKNMAEFHAASFLYLRKTNYKIVEEIPTLKWQFFSSFTNNLFGKDLTEIYRIGISSLDVPEHQENFKILNKIAQKYCELCQSLCDPDSRFNVICLGDCWNNNIFFKYDNDNKVVDMRFIDFQLSHFGTIFHDLLLYILSSTEHRDWESKVKSYLKHYYDSFNTTLKKFEGAADCGFTLEELESEFRRRLPVATQVVFQLSALCLIPPEEFNDPSAEESNDGGLMDEMIKYIQGVATLDSTKEEFKSRTLALYKLAENEFKALADKV